MALITITGLAAARMLAIEAASVVGAAVDGAGNLTFTKHDGTVINAGNIKGPAGTGTTPAGAAGGGLSGTYPNPTIAANSINSSQIVDGSVANAELAALAVTDAKVAAANKDGAAATPSMRTLGTGALQAAAGNHGHPGDWTNLKSFRSTATFGASSTEQNVASVPITMRNGYTYRLMAKMTLNPDTAGMYTSVYIRYGAQNAITGTQLTRDYVDHRIAGRTVTQTFLLTVDWTAADLATYINLSYLGGTGMTAVNGGSASPTILTIEEAITV